MRLATNHHGSFQVLSLQAPNAGHEAGPASLPYLQELSPARQSVDEFIIPIPPRFLAVGRQKVGPTGIQISGHVLHNDGNGVRVLVESIVQLIVWNLFARAVR